MAVGDTLYVKGHPGRTRTGTSTALTLFATSCSIKQSAEPSRLLRLLCSVRPEHQQASTGSSWTAEEAAGILGMPSTAHSTALVSALATAFQPVRAARASKRSEVRTRREKRKAAGRHEVAVVLFLCDLIDICLWLVGWLVGWCVCVPPSLDLTPYHLYLLL